MAFSSGDLLLLRGSGPGKIPKFTSLLDDFSTGALSVTRWNAEYGTVSAASNEMRLTTDAGYTQVSSQDVYDLIGNSVSMEFVPSGLGNAAALGFAAGTENAVYLQYDANNFMSFYRDSGGFYILQFTTGGVYADISISTAGLGNYIRFRESGGTVYWETSLDGVNWNVQRSATTPSWMGTSKGLRLRFQTGIYGTGLTGVSPAYMTIDDVSGVPATSLSVTDTIAGTEQPSAQSAYVRNYFQEVMADTPAAYYRLNDPSGAAIDASGNGRNGSYVVGSGTITRALQSILPAGDGDGSFSLIAPGYMNAFSTTGAVNTPTFAAEAWVRNDLPSTTGNRFLSGGFNSSMGYVVSLTSNKINIAWYKTDGTQGSTSYVHGGAVGRVFHVVVQFTAAGNMELWVDGVMVKQVASTYLPHTTGGSSNAVGSNGTADPLSVDEVAYYAHPLTSARILAHYNAGIAGQTGTDGGALTESSQVVNLVAVSGSDSATATEGTGVVLNAPQATDSATATEGVPAVAIAPVSANRYSAAVLADTPGLYYRLGDATTTLTDSSGNATGATISGASMKYGGLLANDTDLAAYIGPSGVFYLDVYPAAFLTVNRTDEFWFNTDSLSTNGNLWTASNGGTDSNGNGSLSLNANGSITMSWRTTGAVFTTVTTAAGLIQAGQTYHVATRLTATSAELYVNGVQVAANMSTTLAVPSGTTTGRRSFLIPPKGMGYRLDEVASYPFTLSVARIQEHYRIGTGQGTDQSIFHEFASVVQSIGVTDSGTATEGTSTVGIVISIAVTDAIAGSEVSALDITGSVSDAGSAVEGSSALARSSAVSDAITGTELSTVGPGTSDTGTASDSSNPIGVSTTRTDTGTASDSSSLAQTFIISLTDAATATDASSLARSSSVTDAATAVDTSALFQSSLLADTGSLSEVSYLDIVVGLSAADTGSMTETTTAFAAASGSDTSAVTETSGAAAVVAAVEGFTLTESPVIFSIGLGLTDATSSSDMLASRVRSNVADTSGSSDALSYWSRFVAADTSTALDVLSPKGRFPLQDSGSFIDDQSYKGRAQVSDTTSGTDSFTYRVSWAFADAITGADSLGHGEIEHQTRTDTAATSDSASQRAQERLSDVATPLDAIWPKVAGKIQQDAVQAADAATAKAKNRLLDEAAATDQTSITAASLTFDDTVPVIEQVFFRLYASTSDVTEITDAWAYKAILALAAPSTVRFVLKRQQPIQLRQNASVIPLRPSGRGRLALRQSGHTFTIQRIRDVEIDGSGT